MSASAATGPHRKSPHQTETEEQTMGHGLFAWIIIGVVAGWITGKLMKGSGFGFFMDMIVGLIGAVIGGFFSSRLGFVAVGQPGLIGGIVIAVIGALILTAIVRPLTRDRSRFLSSLPP